MKKKVLALFLAITMVFLFCGCDALDELRAQRASMEGENIVHQGVTYIKLPICPALNPEMDYERMVYLADPDVPLLLLTTYAKNIFYQSKDSNFLLHGSEVVYCREELYEQLSSTIAKGWEYTKVFYEYIVYSEDGWDHEEHKYELTQEQIDALETLTTNVEPTTMEDGMYLRRDWTITLQESSEDGYFSRSSGKIVGAGSSYYLVIQDAKLRDQYFKVPDGLVSTFDDITEAYFSTYETDIEIEQNA